MSEMYTIEYLAENTYERAFRAADWQFLITPLENEHQRLGSFSFETSENAIWERSHNGFGFSVIRVRISKPIQKIRFKAVFKVIKTTVNPFEFDINLLQSLPIESKNLLIFKIKFNKYLRSTTLSTLPEGLEYFSFEVSQNLFENLLGLNRWVFETIKYREGVTDVDTSLEAMFLSKQGVCQDFSHLFIALARIHGVPSRYVSGYLHQGMGYYGDAQMHAWAEAYLPGIGWIGFDPTNNILASTAHIKVAHGRDYRDCAPLKGVFYGQGENTTTYQVQVSTQQ